MREHASFPAPSMPTHAARHPALESLTRSPALHNAAGEGDVEKRIGLISTTGFLTATIFKYALGAGITADAGTRLALQ